MNCPYCQSKTVVLDSRVPGEQSENNWSTQMLKTGDELFGWWSDDYRVRKRVCQKCEREFVTIEVATDDFRDAMADVLGSGVML